MRLAFLLYFLTLVVATAEAAPNTDIKPAPIQTKEAPAGPSSKSIQIEPVQPTDSPEQPVIHVRPEDSFFLGTTNVGFGIANGILSEKKKIEEVTVFHLQRTHFNLDESAQEFGISIYSNEFLGADWGFKKFCCFNTFASPWEPYFKLGVAGVYDPEDELGNFIDYKKYFVQGSVGFESFFFSRKRLRLEAGGRFGYSGSHVYGALFYAFPD